eukprot:13751550-Alexandrium_andersonii.AAC.1
MSVCGIDEEQWPWRCLPAMCTDLDMPTIASVQCPCTWVAHAASVNCMNERLRQCPRHTQGLN